MKHVVIVGGGFAGLNCARKLASHPDIRITLIDKKGDNQSMYFPHWRGS
jgi:NADH dehydrogenase